MTPNSGPTAAFFGLPAARSGCGLPSDPLARADYLSARGPIAGRRSFCGRLRERAEVALGIGEIH
jgi:hypothetical protein